MATDTTESTISPEHCVFCALPAEWRDDVEGMLCDEHYYQERAAADRRYQQRLALFGICDQCTLLGVQGIIIDGTRVPLCETHARNPNAVRLDYRLREIVRSVDRLTAAIQADEHAGIGAAQMEQSGDLMRVLDAVARGMKRFPSAT